VASAVGDSDDDATFMIWQRCPLDVATDGVAWLPDGMKRRKMFFYSLQAWQLGALQSAGITDGIDHDLMLFFELGFAFDQLVRSLYNGRFK